MSRRHGPCHALFDAATVDSRTTPRSEAFRVQSRPTSYHRSALASHDDYRKIQKKMYKKKKNVSHPPLYRILYFFLSCTLTYSLHGASAYIEYKKKTFLVPFTPFLLTLQGDSFVIRGVNPRPKPIPRPPPGDFYK